MLTHLKGQNFLHDTSVTYRLATCSLNLSLCHVLPVGYSLSMMPGSKKSRLQGLWDIADLKLAV